MTADDFDLLNSRVMELQNFIFILEVNPVRGAAELHEAKSAELDAIITRLKSSDLMSFDADNWTPERDVDDENDPWGPADEFPDWF